MAASHISPHQRAAEAFARRARKQYGETIESIILYGSVARGEERGVDSDVDLLVVIRDAVDKTEFEEKVRDLAYEIELDRGIVLSLVVRSANEYERQQRSPFFRHVRRDAAILYG